MPVWDNQPGKGKKEVFLRRGKKRPSLIDSMVDLLESKRKSPLSFEFLLSLAPSGWDWRMEPLTVNRSSTSGLTLNDLSHLIDRWRMSLKIIEDHLVWLVTILYSRASKTRYPIEVNVHKDREVVAVNLSTRVVLGRRCLLFFNSLIWNSNQILEFNHWVSLLSKVYSFPAKNHLLVYRLNWSIKKKTEARKGPSLLSLFFPRAGFEPTSDYLLNYTQEAALPLSYRGGA